MDSPAKIEFRDSAIHGQGGFAAQFITKGTLIIQYLGEIINKEESSRRCEANNEYIFCLDDEKDLDGKVDWNPARHINHSCNPNSEAECIDGQIWIVANRDIQAGEEITFNYGYDLVDYQEHPCYCGASNCIGYIVAEEYFEALRNKTVPNV